MERLRFASGDTVTMRILPPAKPRPMHFFKPIKEKSCFVCDEGHEAELVRRIPLLLHVQVRFPRSKKVRIRKKWSKQPKNFKDVLSTVDLYPHQVEALQAWQSTSRIRIT